MSLILSLSLIIGFVLFYILMIQIFTVLFRLTGLTREKAHFQVISLLTNSGYTTNETELITNNKTRRKIAKFAMISGTIFNVVIASLVINTLLSVRVENSKEVLTTMGILIISFILFLLFLRLPFVKRLIEQLIEKIIARIRKRKMKENIITVVDSYGKKGIVEVYLVELPEGMEGKPLEQTFLRSRYNINLLTIRRHDKSINVKKETILQKGDRLVLFGKVSTIKELFLVQAVVKEEKHEDEDKLNKLSIIDNYGVNALVEIRMNHVPDIIKNKKLSESNLKEKFDITVLMIKHEDKAILVDADSKLMVGDKVVLIGPYEHIENLFIDEIEI